MVTVFTYISYIAYIHTVVAATICAMRFFQISDPSVIKNATAENISRLHLTQVI